MRRSTVCLVDDATDVRHVLVRGPIRQWLKDRQVPAYWSRPHRGFLVRRERIPDLVARLEHDGYVVRGAGS